MRVGAPSVLKRHRALLAVLVLFWICGLAYDVSTPLFEGLDELWHFALIKHLADGNSLPVQRVGEDPPWRQEGNQPPLYYVLLASAVRWIDTDDYWSHRMLHTEELTTGDPYAEGEKFYFYHTRAEAFPYRRTTLAVHVGRWISLAMATGTVILAYALAREVVPHRPAVAPLAAAIVAFNPEFLFVSAQVNNDNLSNLLGAVTALLLVRLWNRGFSLSRSIGLSVVVGLMALTKLNGLVLALVVGLVATLVAVRDRDWRGWLRLAVLGIGLTALIAGWWYVRNVRLYGDLFGLSVMDSYVGSRSLTVWQALQEFDGLHFSYWGLFGIANILMPLWFYAIYAIGTLVAGVGVVVFLIDIYRRRSILSHPVVVTLLVGLAVVAGTVYWTAHSTGPMGRLAFTGIGSLSLLGALGMCALVPERGQSVVAAGVSVGMAALALAVPFTSIRPTYRPDAMRKPPLVEEAPTPEVSYEAFLEDDVALRGYELDRGERALHITLHWEVLARTDEHLLVFVHLYDEQGEIETQDDGVPMGGTYPSEVWSPGEWLVDRHTLSLSDVPGGEYSIGVGMYRWGDLTRLTAHDGEGDRYLHDIILLPETVVVPSF